MPIRVIVVDDEQAAIDVLTYHIGNAPSLDLLATFQDGRQAIQYCLQHHVDLLFCDIEMPLMNGLEVAQRQLGKTAIIFTTAHTNYAVRAFELNIVDYLVKPISYERLLQAVNKYKELYPAQGADHFFVKTGTKGHLEKINIEDIIQVEGAKNYINIFHGSAKTMTLLNLKDLEQRLPAKAFIRIQKSSIVAIKHIQGTKGGSVLLSNGNLVTIGPTYKEQVMKVINSRLIN